MSVIQSVLLKLLEALKAEPALFFRTSDLDDVSSGRRPLCLLQDCRSSGVLLWI